MTNSRITLRGHHLLTITQEYSDKFQRWGDNLRKSMFKDHGIIRRVYSDEDVSNIPKVYQSIIENAPQRIDVIMGIDDVCKICSNHDGNGCTIYTQEQLLFEDTRTLRIFFPNIVLGDPILLSDILQP